MFISYRISKSGEESLTISGFYCHGENIFLQLETTAPAPRKRSRKKRIRKYFLLVWDDNACSQKKEQEEKYKVAVP
ncbi:hypothetical protein KUTeg_011081, partial [Tegillarca granosa]